MFHSFLSMSLLPQQRLTHATHINDMIHYANRLPPNKPVRLLNNGRVRKTCTVYNSRYFKAIESLIDKQMKNPDPLVVPIYSFLSKVDIEPTNGRSGAYSYQYEMMRCGILPADQKDFICEVGDAHDLYGRRLFEKDANVRHKSELYPELADFLNKIVFRGDYWDIHEDNIMFNEDGNYVLIDLEGFIMEPYYE